MIPSAQRTDEWIEGCDWALHERQFKEPYRITSRFMEWLTERGCFEMDPRSRIADFGAGMGANTYFFAKQNAAIDFLGFDINPECVHRGNERLKELGAKNCHLEVADLYNLDPKYYRRFNGIISCATLSWLPDLPTAVSALAKLEPQWIAATSLFYDGPIDCIIETRDYSRPLESGACTTKFYNIYSIENARHCFAELGYTQFDFVPFQIDIDLARPASHGMGTYTEKLGDGRRLQISGPLLMPWYFILARKS